MLLGKGRSRCCNCLTKQQLNSKKPLEFTIIWEMFIEKGDLDAAIAFYKTELQFNNFRPDVYNNLGSAFRKKGDIDEALITTGGL